MPFDHKRRENRVFEKGIEYQIHTQSREECNEIRAKSSERESTPRRIVNGMQVSYHDHTVIIP